MTDSRSWMTVREASRLLGVSDEVVRLRIKRHDLFGRRTGNGPRARWEVDTRQVHEEVERQARDLRFRGAISGYGDAFVPAVEEAFGPAAATAVADTATLDDLTREAAAVAADPDLQAAFAALDEAAAEEAEARAIADRVRRRERINRLAMEMLAEDDEAEEDD